MPIEKIKELFTNPDVNEEMIGLTVNGLDHFEVARRLNELSVDEKIQVFNSLETDEKRQELLYETDHDSRLEIQKSLDKDYLAKLLDNMPEDEATDILKEHDEEVQEEILSKMGPQDADIIKNLISYEEETAGGLMNPRFNRVLEHQTASDILMNLKREANHDIPPYFYVTSNKQELIGYFKLRDLLNVPPNLKASQFLREKTPKILIHDSCDKIAQLMDNEHLSTLPVVDDKNVIHGIVTFDDVIRIMQDIASEDIFTMVGTSKVDPFAKKMGGKITARAPWLFITFLGGLCSASILGYFEGTLSEYVTIVFFVPFVIGLSGNIGIQGATVIVRGLATGDIQADNLKKVIRSEILVGISNGAIFGASCGALVAAISGPILHTSPILGIVVAAGIILAVLLSSMIGSLSPFLFLKLNIDPAISTGPFVTVINDFLGITIYLTTATAIYSLL